MKSKFLSLCLSVVMAVGIWLYVITVVSPESQDTFRNIPVQMESVALLEERGLVITGISNADVSLQLFGKRTDLIQLNSGNIRVYADVSKIYEAGVHEIAYSVAFPGSIPSGAVEIQSRSPDSIRVTVEKKVSKKVDVEVVYEGAVPSGYLTDEANIQLSTKSINISGPRSYLDAVASARVVVDLTNRTETISDTYPFVLVDSSGNTVDDSAISADISTVHLNLQIRQLKQVPLTFDVIYGGGATKENTTVVANMTSVQISGHKNVLQDITAIHLGVIDLSQVVQSRVIVLPIEIPTGVRNETGTDEVSITVTFTGLETKTLFADNIVPVNLPEGMVAVFVEKKLSVTIRGTKEELDAVSEDDVTVVVDFGSTREGTSTMTAKIVIETGGASNVGAIGNYTLIADMHRGE